MSTDWHDEAACSGSNADLFFPERGADQRPAKAICARCPVRLDCLEWALANGETSGIWGGLNERERRRGHHDKRAHECPLTVTGSTAGVQRHRKLGQNPCKACRKEYNTWKASRRRVAGMTPQVSYSAEPVLDILVACNRSKSSMGGTVARALQRGRLSTNAAKKAADELGLHPVEIWDDWEPVAEVAA